MQVQSRNMFYSLDLEHSGHRGMESTFSSHLECCIDYKAVLLFSVEFTFLLALIYVQFMRIHALLKSSILLPLLHLNLNKIHETFLHFY